MIRELQNEDVKTVMQLWLNGNKDAHPFIPEEYWELNYTMVEEQLLQAEVFVYEEQGEIQGFVGVVGHYIAGIFVDRTCRSRGIGKQLLDYVKQKYGDVSLSVYQKNKGAIAFYFREGFSVQFEAMDGITGENEYTMIWKAEAEKDAAGNA